MLQQNIQIPPLIETEKQEFIPKFEFPIPETENGNPQNRGEDGSNSNLNSTFCF